MCRMGYCRAEWKKVAKSLVSCMCGGGRKKNEEHEKENCGGKVVFLMRMELKMRLKEFLKS